MTNDQFRNWRASMYFTQVAAAEALHASLNTIKGYEGKNSIPGWIELACCELWRRRDETPKEAEVRAAAFGAILNTKPAER